MPANLIGILGVIVILAIAVAFSSNRKAIHLRVVAAAFVLQAGLAAIVLYSPWGRSAIETMSTGVLAVIGFSKAGIDMVFGPLANVDVVGFSFAFNVLPIIIFFAALMSVLYHMGIMQLLVKVVGGALHKFIGTGAIESMNAAANIFIGQTEAPLVVKPYLRGLTEAQFFTVMVSGVSSIAGTVLAGYVLMGADIQYLLAAAFMAAPGGLLMAKIIMPDDEYIPPSRHEKLEMEPSHHANIILAAAAGTADGLRLAVNIGAMLVAFVALIALFNGLVGGLSGLLGIDTLLGVEEVTLQLILGKIFTVFFTPLLHACFTVLFTVRFTAFFNAFFNVFSTCLFQTANFKNSSDDTTIRNGRTYTGNLFGTQNIKHKNIPTVSLLMFRNITQTYRHTTPPRPPPPSPPFLPKEREGLVPPHLWGGGGRGWGGVGGRGSIFIGLCNFAEH